MRRPRKNSTATNTSKRDRVRDEKNPEFGTLGVLIGLLVGLAVGLVAEVVRGGGMIVMQLGGAGGALLGTAVEGLRFWWRRRR